MAGASAMALIDMHHLHVAQRLDDISLSLDTGEMLGIIGPNGAGKSTLLHAIASILDYQGDIHFKGTALSQLSPPERARAIGLLPQSGNSAWSLTVEEIVALGRLPWHDRNSAAIQQAIGQANLAALQHKKIDQLSGGERARVWLARVLAGQPQLLLADEPIANLDLYYQRSVMQMLRQYADRQRGVILAIHDLGLAARYCDRLCLIHRGRIHAWGTPADVLTSTNLETVFNVTVHIDLNASPPLVVPH